MSPLLICCKGCRGIEGKIESMNICLRVGFSYFGLRCSLSFFSLFAMQNDTVMLLKEDPNLLNVLFQSVVIGQLMEDFLEGIRFF